MKTRKRILAVDDDALTLKLLKVRLAKNGYEVLTARSEREFWQHAFDPAVTLIILDLCVKDRLGTDIYGSLLEFGMNRNIPVIFITGLEEGCLPAEVRDSGRPCLKKPIDFEKLKSEIAALQRGRVLQDAAGGSHE
jgi:DNA-binding response OmpR family regulator